MGTIELVDNLLEGEPQVRDCHHAKMESLY